MEDETVVMTVRIPKTLIEKIDKLAKRLGYTRRAELVRQALREFIEKHSNE